MKISELSIYPIKSCHKLSLSSIEIQKHSMKNDREWAVFGEDGQVITGRTHPQLLDIKCALDESSLSIYHESTLIDKIPIHVNQPHTQALKIFSYDSYGYSVNHRLNQWFSDFLKTNCQFVKVDLASPRPVLAKHGGKDKETLGFADQAPLLLLSRASMKDLNDKLNDKITIDRFRPNIVLTDTSPFEEDHLDLIQIGDCKLRVIQQCIRCVFTTIDQLTKKKHPQSEPLRTLSTFRKGTKGGVVFGVHAVPLNEGIISLDSPIKVISKKARPVEIT